MKKAATKEAQHASEADSLRLCACGCGQAPRIKGSIWLQGHDARYKQKLVREFDEGNNEAGKELVQRGWATQELLNLRRAKVDTGNLAKRHRLRIRVQRLDERITQLERHRKALRVQLVVAEQPE